MNQGHVHVKFFTRLKSRNVLQTQRRSSSYNRGTNLRLIQAKPLVGYYAELLSNPLEMSPPTSLQDKKDRASVVFGPGLAGPKYHGGAASTPESAWQVINGTRIPPRPAEPENCCMSGCAHCVWDDYQEELEKWASEIKKAKSKVQAPTMGGGTSLEHATLSVRANEDSFSNSCVKSGGGGDEANLIQPNTDELMANIPVGIREFMRTEKGLREKQRKATGP